MKNTVSIYKREKEEEGKKDPSGKTVIVSLLMRTQFLFLKST